MNLMDLLLVEDFDLQDVEVIKQTKGNLNYDQELYFERLLDDDDIHLNAEILDENLVHDQAR